MINQFCREESYSSGIQTNANSEKYYKSLHFIKELDKQPDFIDTFTKFNKQTLVKEKLQNLVEQVTQQIIECINKKVHEAFYREINLLVSQVLSIRQEMTIFSREQFKYRQQLKSQVTIQQLQLKEQIRKINRMVQLLRKQNRNFSIPTFCRHSNSKLQEKEYQKSSISNQSHYQNMQIKKEILGLTQKIEELKQQTTKQQYKLSNRIDQTKERHSNAFNSLRNQIQEIQESIASQEIIQKDVKLLFQTVQKLKECLFDYQRQVSQLKEDFNRYQDSGIFYISDRQ